MIFHAFVSNLKFVGLAWAAALSAQQLEWYVRDLEACVTLVFVQSG